MSLKYLSFAEQVTVFSTITGLAAQHPDLPGAYIVVPSLQGIGISVQVRWMDDFERWREALGADTADVVLSSRGSPEATVVVAGTTVWLYATETVVER